MKTRVACIRCHEVRHHQSRGLCKKCFRELRDTDQLDLYPPMKWGEKQAVLVEVAEESPMEYSGRWVRRGLVYYAEEVAS